MISKSALYRKSPKGIEAIANRQSGLGPKLRPMLILVDGKRSFDQLLGLSAMFGNTEELLNQLLADGFIDEVAVEAPVEKTAPPVSGFSLSQAQRFAVRRLTDIMGPSAEPLCIRIETTRNWQEFDAAVAHAQEMLSGFRGAQLADSFAAEMQSHRRG